MDNFQEFLISTNGKISQAAARFEKMIALMLPPVLIAVDEDGFLKGSITDGDIRRFIIQHNKTDDIVANVMNKNCFRARAKSEISASNLTDFKVVPIIDIHQKVIDILYQNNQKNLELLSKIVVVINAGGMGTRLYPYNKIYPKPLVPVNRIPMIDHVIQSFSKYGVTQFKLVLNHKKEMIKEYFSYRPQVVDIEYFTENEPYGTVGGLSLVNNISRTFIFTNCDILVEHDLSLILDFHKKNKHKLTIVSSMLTNTIPYGVLTTNSVGVLKSIHEKPTTNYFVSTGLYIMEAELIRSIPKSTKFDMDKFIESLLNSKVKVGIYPIEYQQWSDMGTIEGLIQTEKKLEDKMNYINASSIKFDSFIK